LRGFRWAEKLGHAGWLSRGCGPGKRLVLHGLHHFLSHAEAHRHLAGGSCGGTSTVGTTLSHGLRHLEFYVVVEISDGAHTRPLVDGCLDFRRDGNVLDEEAGDLDSVFGGDLRVDQRQQRFAEFRVARGHVERWHAAGREGIAENANNPRTHGIGELVEPEMLIRAGDFFEENRRINDFEIEGAEGPQPDDAEVRVAHHDRVRSAPFVAGEKTGRDEIDVCLERRLKTVFPAFEFRQDRNVIRDERVFSRGEAVAELAQIDELSGLAFADDELCAVLDRLVFVGKTPRQRVTRVVVEFDDFEKFAFDESEYVHGF